MLRLCLLVSHNGFSGFILYLCFAVRQFDDGPSFARDWGQIRYDPAPPMVWRVEAYRVHQVLQAPRLSR
jgi:hypothetical protein